MSALETTQDALFGGALPLRQPRRGYRVNVDSLFLAAFAARGRIARLAVDLGSGVGVLGMVLCAVRAARTVGLVESDPELVRLACDNLAANRFEGSVHTADLARDGLPRELRQRAELVVCNPPFFPPSTGTPTREPRVQRARSGSLEPFVRAARLALAGTRGRVAFCYPARGLADLFELASAEGLVAKRLRFVQARAELPARLALVELKPGKPGGLVVEPPLVEWHGRSRSPEVSAIVAGRFHRSA